MRLFRSILLLGACLAVPAFPINAVLTGDTYVTPSQPSMNFGRLPQLSVDAATQSVALLRFNLESLPPGTPHWQVARATLRVWVSRSTGPAGFSVGMASNPWDELAVTHPTRPGTLTPNGSVHTAPSGANQWAVLDVTYFVQLWLGGTPNHGFVLTPTHGTVFLSSKEGASSGHAPELEIVLSGPQGPTGPPGPQGLQGPRGPQGLPGTSSLVGRITRVVSTTDLGGGLQGLRFVSCPASHPQLISGGCGHRDFNSAADDIHVNFTGPELSAPNSQWRCIFDNNSNESRAVQAIAICSQ